MDEVVIYGETNYFSVLALIECILCYAPPKFFET